MLLGDKRVLIIGGLGFIGRYLIHEFLAAGWSVLVLDDLSSSTLEPVIVHPALSIHVGSVLDRQRLSLLLGKSDLVINLAGVVGMKLAHAQRERSYRVSVEGTANILDLAHHQPLVCMSSSAVYGVHRNESVSERDACSEDEVLAYDGGLPGYATGKLHMEQLALSAAAGGQQVLLVRPFNVVGIGQSSHYGMVIPTFVRQALLGDPIEIHGDGLQTRSFCDVDEFARIFRQLVENPVPWDASLRIINVGNPIQTQILDLAHLVLTTADSSSALVHIPYESVYPGKTDVRVRAPDISRLLAILGNPEWPSIAQTVAKVVQHERKKCPSESTVPCRTMVSAL